MKITWKDNPSLIVTAIATIGSFIIIFNDSGEFFKSLAAALMVGGLTWIAYVLVKWVILALTNKE